MDNNVCNEENVRKMVTLESLGHMRRKEGLASVTLAGHNKGKRDSGKHR